MGEWTFITNHGLVLTYVAKHPHSTGREIAQAIDITERTILKIISDLETEGYINRQKQGRNNVYQVNPDIGLRHETTADVMVGDLLKVMGWRSRRSSSSNK